MAEIIKTEFYNGATLIGERTVAPFLSFTWAGDSTPGGTSPVLSAKIYLDNDVVITSDSISVVVRSEVTTQWYDLTITDYKARVESDYGVLESEAALTTALSTMVEQDYNNLIAWYNPNGGHRTGKIYDVRDIGSAKNLFGNDDFTGSEWNRLVQAGQEQGHLNYQGQATATKLYAVSYNSNYMIQVTEENVQLNNLNKKHVLSAEVKKGTLQYFVMGAYLMGSDDNWARFDLNSGTIQANSSNVSNVLIQDIGNSYYRVSYEFTPTSDDKGHFYMGFRSDPTNSAVTSTDYGFASQPQLIEANAYELAAANPTLDLTVTGGGGTRINKAGQVERIEYYNYVHNSHDVTQWSNKTNIAVQQIGGESVITDNSTAGTHQVGQYINAANPYPVRTLSVDVKKVDHRYVLIGTGFSDQYIIYDFDTNAITSNTIANAGGMAVQIDTTILTDGWVAISFLIYQTSSVYKYFVMGLSSDGTTISYTGTGKSVKFRKPQAIESGATKILKPYQVNINAAAFPKIDYSTGKPAFLIEPTRTNLIPKSYDYTGWAFVDCTVTLNQVGITGEANTACTVTGTGGTDQMTYNLNGITSARYRSSIWIKKDTNQTRFAEVVVITASGDIVPQLNTQTGATIFRGGSTLGTSTVLDRGDWWEWVIITNVATTNNTLIVRPSISTTFGTYEAGATGSIIVGHVGVYNSSVVNETPIITNGSAVTRTASYFSGVTSVDTTQGYYYMNFKLYTIPSAYWMGIQLSKDGDIYNRYGLLFDEISGSLYLQHYTRTTNYANHTYNHPMSLDTEYKALVRWKDGYAYFYVNGVLVYSGLSGTPDMNKIDIGTSAVDRNGLWHLYEVEVSSKDLTDQEAINMTTI